MAIVLRPSKDDEKSKGDEEEENEDLRKRCGKMEVNESVNPVPFGAVKGHVKSRQDGPLHRSRVVTPNGGEK